MQRQTFLKKSAVGAGVAGAIAAPLLAQAAELPTIK